MTQPQTILLAIVAAGVLILGYLGWRAVRCTAGWRVWFLANVARVYIGVMLSWRANKPCPFPRDQAAIIIANHTSPVDPVLLWYRHNIGWPRHAMRTIGFLVAGEYVERPDIIGWVCRVMESIPVKRTGRDMGAVRQALKRLAAGKWLGIFPEGGINRTPECGLQPGNTGVAFISLKSGVPVYPVFIHNSPRGKTMARSFFKRSRVRITYGEPIDLSQKYGDRKLNAETLDAATEFLMEKLRQLGEKK